MALAVDVGQAALNGGITRQESPRIHAQREPVGRGGHGDLYVLVQGGNDDQAASFGRTVAATFLAAESDGIASALVKGMRQAAQTMSVDVDFASPGGELGAIGAVHAGDQLYLAQLLPSQVFVLRDGILNSLPAEPQPASSTPVPDQDVEIFRVELEPSDVVVLSSTEIRRALTEREIQGLLQGRSAQRAAHDLCSVAAQRGSSTCDIVVLGVMAETPAPVAAPSVDETWMSAGPAGPMPTNGMASRTAPAAPPEGVWEEPSQPRERPTGAPVERSLVQRMVTLPFTAVLMLLILPVMAARGLVRLVTGRSESAPPAPPPAPTRNAGSTSGDPMEDDWSSLRTLREAGPQRVESPRASPTQATPPLSAVGQPMPGRQDPFRYRPRRSLPGPGTLLFGVSLVLLAVMAVVLVVRNSESTPGPLDAIPGEAVSTEPGVATPGFVSPAVGIERATELFAEAEARYREALDRDPDENRAAVLLVLRDAKDLANEALQVDPGRALAPDINRLLSQIGREEDRLNRVRTVVTSATIGEFDSAGVGSAAEQMDVRVDAKYVIDATAGRVVSFVTAKQGTTVLRKGEVVSAVTIQDPIAVVNRALSVLVLDSRYNLVSLQADQNPRLLRIAGTETWRTPVAFDNFNNNFYVLDPGANAIHKYQATAGGYEVAPSSYVPASADVELSSAIDMAIDGDIFVLNSDGSILRLRGGQEVPFEITGLAGDTLKATRIFTEVETDSLYLVDSSNKRIVEIDKREESDGAFVRQFKYAGSDDFFADIRGIWVSEIDGKLIVLGTDSIRQFVLPTIQDEA